MIHRTFRYRLAPTPQQEELFRQHAGVCRLVYNLALEQRRDHWRQYRAATGRSISFPSQSRELTDLRNQFPFIGEVSRVCVEQALRDLDEAFSRFFSRKSAFPSVRRRGFNDSFRHKASDIVTKRVSARWSAVRVPKIGWIKYRYTRPISGVVRNATIIHDALGWHVNFACEVEHELPANNNNPSVGIDLGIANTLALSTGEMLSLPTSLDRLARRHRAAQRVLARRHRDSKRRAKALQRCIRLSAKRARIRKDWHHKAALAVARQFGTVVIEDLKVSSMTRSGSGTVESPGTYVSQKRGLNRSILNQGWYTFQRILAYKLEERGGTLIKVNPAYTSQTCSGCGAIDRESRKSQASFSCRHCGFRAHADHNAAINILRRNTASMRAEDGRWATDETRTSQGDSFVHQAAA